MSKTRKLLILAGLAGAGVWAWLRFPLNSDVVQTQDKPHFPTVTGTNLDRVDLQFPRDFKGEVNIVFLAFWQRQQLEVNTWIPLARELEAQYDCVAHYEFPTIDNMTGVGRLFVNEGMRSGIPDPIARERTITLYLDKRPFLSALDITDQETIYTLLVDKQGQVLWRENGELTEAKQEALTAFLQIYQPDTK